MTTPPRLGSRNSAAESARRGRREGRSGPRDASGRPSSCGASRIDRPDLRRHRLRNGELLSGQRLFDRCRHRSRRTHLPNRPSPDPASQSLVQVHLGSRNRLGTGRGCPTVRNGLEGDRAPAGRRGLPCSPQRFLREECSQSLPEASPPSGTETSGRLYRTRRPRGVGHPSDPSVGCLRPSRHSPEPPPRPLRRRSLRPNPARSHRQGLASSRKRSTVAARPGKRLNLPNPRLSPSCDLANPLPGPSVPPIGASHPPAAGISPLALSVARHAATTHTCPVRIAATAFPPTDYADKDRILGMADRHFPRTPNSGPSSRDQPKSDTGPIHQHARAGRRTTARHGSIGTEPIDSSVKV